MLPVNANDGLRSDIARARASAVAGLVFGIVGVLAGIAFFVVYAGLFDAPWLHEARRLFAGLGAIAMLFGVWSIVDHLPRVGTLGRALAHPDEVTAEPATLRRQPAARLRLADGRSIVIPTSQPLPRSRGEG